MACKVVDPGGNILCEYLGHYFVRKRHRNGAFYSDWDWVGITEDFYNMFKDAGSKVVDPPYVVKKYMHEHYPELCGK